MESQDNHHGKISTARPVVRPRWIHRPVRAAGTTYQVTGPVLEVTPTKLVIQKENEKWEVARTADTKVTGEIKVGSKVTVHYTMTATTVEVKTEKAAAPAKPEKKPK